MLIWQGKNRLGQTDRSEIGGITDGEGKATGVPITLVINPDEANV